MELYYPNYDIEMDIDEKVSIAAVEEEPIEEEEEEDSNLDTEEALNCLEEYDNLTQLKLLKKEINHIISHNVEPNEGWYDERFRHIRIYAQLSWIELAQKFQDRDQYIVETTAAIMKLCYDLMEECSVRPNFNLYNYYKLIHKISNIWQYYYSNYVSEEEDKNEDDEISKLVEGMTQLWR
jgi:hypothetical protein